MAKLTDNEIMLIVRYYIGDLTLDYNVPANLDSVSTQVGICKSRVQRALHIAITDLIASDKEACRIRERAFLNIQDHMGYIPSTQKKVYNRLFETRRKNILKQNCKEEIQKVECKIEQLRFSLADCIDPQEKTDIENSIFELGRKLEEYRSYLNS